MTSGLQEVVRENGIADGENTGGLHDGKKHGMAPIVEKSREGEGAAALELIGGLCDALEAAEIRYCHWKSNSALDRSASGRNDLDLLVDRGDAQKFGEILGRLDFKQAQTPKDRQLPGILDYYGYDPGSGRLVHVHVHYQLVLGHDLSKNYHLPLERPYLESSVRSGLFKIPAPEYEFTVFVIRMIIKHSTWDAILMGPGRLSGSEKEELEYLRSRITPEKVRSLVDQYLPLLSGDPFESACDALSPGCPMAARVRAGRQLQKALCSCRRRAHALDVSLRYWRRVSRGIGWRLFRRAPKMRMSNGGRLVAIVGGDGAGKTTAIDSICGWLSKGFAVRKVHLGKPPWSMTTIVVRLLLKAGSLLGLWRSNFQHDVDPDPAVFPGYPAIVRAVCTARDRSLLYARARRVASNGGLVICDRFPLPGIVSMDGPVVRRITASHHTNAFTKYLINLETRFYRRILAPDVLVVMRLDPDIAVQRKTDEDPASVRARTRKIWELDWSGTAAHVIDARQSKEDVLSDLKGIIWSQI